MTVKELMDYLRECPEDANINVKNYHVSTPYYIKELAGFFDGDKNVVNIYITLTPPILRTCGTGRGKDRKENEE